MFKSIRRWFLGFFLSEKELTLDSLVLENYDLRKELAAANTELKEWRSKPEADMMRRSAESEANALHARTLAIESLKLERKRYSAVIRKLLRLCITADVIMHRKRAKKGVTIEAAKEWMADFEELKKEHINDIADLDG